MHVFPPGFCSVPNWLWAALEWSEAVLTEHDSDEVAGFFTNSHCTSLRNSLSDDLFGRLVARWPAEAEPPLEGLSPWAAWMLLPSKLVELSPGVETQLMEGHQGARGFLEAPEEFVGRLDTVPAEIYADLIEKILAKPEAVRQNIGELYRAWLSHDIKQVEASLSSAPVWQVPSLRAAMFEARNRSWKAVGRASCGAAPSGRATG